MDEDALDTLGIVPATYEDRVEVAERERMGHVARQLARITIDPIVRQMLGYMLDEAAWRVDPIDLMAINPVGVVVARVTLAEKPRDPFLTYLRGPPPPPTVGFAKYATYETAQKSLRDVAARAELSADDAAWLLGMPRVKDMRGTPDSNVEA